MKNISVLIVMFFAVTLASCFQVVEEIDLNGDGSGHMVLTLNLSESKTKIASVLKMKTFNGRAIPSQSEIVSRIKKTAETIGETPGISNVKTHTDFNNYIAEISFRFKDVSQVNAVSKRLFTEYKIKIANAAVYNYNKTDKVFSRKYIHNAETKKAYNTLNATDKAVFENADYTCIYRFASPVASQSNTTAKISKSGKAVMQQTTMLSVIHARTNLSNTIKLK